LTRAKDTLKKALQKTSFSKPNSYEWQKYPAVKGVLRASWQALQTTSDDPVSGEIPGNMEFQNRGWGWNNNGTKPNIDNQTATKWNKRLIPHQAFYLFTRKVRRSARIITETYSISTYIRLIVQFALYPM
jgi:hypothetical protein